MEAGVLGIQYAMDETVADSPTREPPLTRLHPNHKTVMRIEAMILAVPVTFAALGLEIADILPTGMVFAPVVVLLVALVLFVPQRRYFARGYDMGADRLRVVRGLMFHHDTVVPFGRVQHLDVEQGPLERAFGIARLILHTAGTHNASVTLPGLAHDTALEMREAIRQHVKRETA